MELLFLIKSKKRRWPQSHSTMAWSLHTSAALVTWSLSDADSKLLGLTTNCAERLLSCQRWQHFRYWQVLTPFPSWNNAVIYIKQGRWVSALFPLHLLLAASCRSALQEPGRTSHSLQNGSGSLLLPRWSFPGRGHTPPRNKTAFIRRQKIMTPWSLVPRTGPSLELTGSHGGATSSQPGQHACHWADCSLLLYIHLCCGPTTHFSLPWERQACSILSWDFRPGNTGFSSFVLMCHWYLLGIAGSFRHWSLVQQTFSQTSISKCIN